LERGYQAGRKRLIDLKKKRECKRGKRKEARGRERRSRKSRVRLRAKKMNYVHKKSSSKRGEKGACSR